MSRRALLLWAVLAIVAAGCSNRPDATAAPTTSAVADASTTSTVPAADPDPATDDGIVVDGPVPERGAISTTTGPLEWGRPELAWEPVAGAVRYEVTLFAPDGYGYWAWQGTATSVHVGGEPQLLADAAGPTAVTGMTWQVLAIGPDGAVIALSERTAIGP